MEAIPSMLNGSRASQSGQEGVGLEANCGLSRRPREGVRHTFRGGREPLRRQHEAVLCLQVEELQQEGVGFPVSRPTAVKRPHNRSILGRQHRRLL